MSVRPGYVPQGNPDGAGLAHGARHDARAQNRCTSGRSCALHTRRRYFTQASNNAQNTLCALLPAVSLYFELSHFSL